MNLFHRQDNIFSQGFGQLEMNAAAQQQACNLMVQHQQQAMSGLSGLHNRLACAMPDPAVKKPKPFIEELQDETDKWLNFD